VDRPSCYDKAAELLARRPHFRAQLAQKLAARGYPEAEVSAALDRLAGHGWLDDRRTARDYAAGRLSRAPQGRRRLAAELTRRGAPAAVIDDVLAELVPSDDRAAARAAADRWAARRGRGGEADLRALARHLERRGFSAGAIREALWERGADDAADD
jgi:regulatory protein